VKCLFTGEDLYKGLFQFRGDFANQTQMTSDAKELINSKLTESDLRKVNKAYDDVVAGINTFDPLFFQNFQSDLYSGDFNKVEKALSGAAETSIAALISDKSSTELTDSEKSILRNLSEEYNLSDANDLKAFVVEANNRTRLDIDLESLEGFGGDIDDPVALSTFYAAVVAVLVAAVLSLAVAVHAVVAYAGVVAAQAVYVYDTTLLDKWPEERLPRG
jgi:SdpC family antimicrobial peptide